ncbi:MAG: threonine synthase [Terriglobales bacterium]
MANISFLECSRCGEHFDAAGSATTCPKDGAAFYVRYDLAAIRKKFSRDSVRSGPASMWRYAAVLPDAAPVTLGEGFTPLLHSRDNPSVLIKDEGLNPTGTFKARGLALAVTMARAHGLKKLAIASAGNAASALAAYAAAAGLEAHVVVPRDAPRANIAECQAYGAEITLIDGLINDCARVVAERAAPEGWFDVSAFREPFRVEGKKTMGYELAEQLGWTLPDAVVYPTGGGVGLVGMCKAFAEMEELGWLESGTLRPRLIAVQSSGCASIVKAWDEGKTAAEVWPNAVTVAAGLRVPKSRADDVVLNILRQSQGNAIAVTDAEIMDALRDWARREGVLAAPEGATSYAAYRKLIASGFLRPQDKVALFNTGSGLKYMDVITRESSAGPKSRQIGGIIGPY